MDVCIQKVCERSSWDQLLLKDKKTVGKKEFILRWAKYFKQIEKAF